MNGKRAKQIRSYARSVKATKARYRKIKEGYTRKNQGQNPVFAEERKRSPNRGTHAKVKIDEQTVVSSLRVGRPRRIWRENEPIHVLHPNKQPPKAKKAEQPSGPAN